MKRGALACFLIILLAIPIVLAQSQNELRGAGLTPDDTLYFIDEFFDRFSSDLDNREEKVAEILAMIEAGNIDAALKALEKYKERAENAEREVSPEERETAKESAAIIRAALEQAEIPDDFQDEIQEVIKQEEEIETAAEIAAKIKDLCEELYLLDLNQYEKTCKTGDDSPRWLQELDKELTDEQKKEAEEFFKIMSQCFEGFETGDYESCRCGEIGIAAFANKCEEVLPLAIECEEGNENACDKVDEETEDIHELLPEYLQTVLAKIENRFEDERYDYYGGPEECEGITDRAACEEIIFKKDAPPECVEEIEKRNLKFDKDFGTGEAHELCEEILFDFYAPEECKKEGITNHEECGKLLWDLYTPQECKDAGLTGENPHDNRKCDEIMNGLYQDDFHSGPDINFNCKEIEDPEERLACYDGASSQVQGYHDVHDDSYDGPCLTEEEFEEKVRQCKDENPSNYWLPVEGDSGDGYTCAIDIECGTDDSFADEIDDEYETDFYDEYYEDEFDDNTYEEYDDERDEESHEENEQEYSSDSGESSGTESETTTSDNEEESEMTDQDTDSDTAPITGSVIAIDNPFLNYFFSR